MLSLDLIRERDREREHERTRARERERLRSMVPTWAEKKGRLQDYLVEAAFVRVEDDVRFLSLKILYKFSVEEPITLNSCSILYTFCSQYPLNTCAHLHGSGGNRAHSHSSRDLWVILNLSCRSQIYLNFFEILLRYYVWIFKMLSYAISKVYHSKRYIGISKRIFTRYPKNMSQKRA